MSVNNGSVGIRAVVMSGRNGYRFTGSKSNLKGNVSTSATVTRVHRTYFENAENLVEAQPPASDLPFLFLRAEDPRNSASFTLLHNVFLDLVCSPAIGNSINRVHRA